MTTTLCCLFLLLLPLGAMPAELKIVSWNIDHGSRLEPVLQQLRALGAAVYALQEVDLNAKRSGSKDIAKELATSLGMQFAYGKEFQELSQGTEAAPAFIGQATLSHLPVRRSRTLEFKRQSNFWKPNGLLPSNIPLMQRRLGKRVALVTELDFAGTLLVVYNPHLESRSFGRIQTEQLNEMLEDMKQYPASIAIVIAGDINSKYFPSIFLHKLEKAGFQSALGKRTPRTHAIAMSLDWIFVRGPFKIQSGEVLQNAKGSDHYPIVVSLSTP